MARSCFVAADVRRLIPPSVQQPGQSLLTSAATWDAPLALGLGVLDVLPLCLDFADFVVGVNAVEVVALELGALELSDVILVAGQATLARHVLRVATGAGGLFDRFEIADEADGIFL